VRVSAAALDGNQDLAARMEEEAEEGWNGDVASAGDGRDASDLAVRMEEEAEEGWDGDVAAEEDGRDASRVRVRESDNTGRGGGKRVRATHGM